MAHAFDYKDQLVSETCCNCGVVFALPNDLKKQLLGNRRLFYCPNGHPQHYTGETEAEKLKKELEREKQRREMAENTATAEAKRAAKAEETLKRERHRVGNGVCPCCNRTFRNLMRHMETKHPEHKS